MAQSFNPPPAYSGPYQPSYPQLQPQAPYYPPVFMVQPQQQQQQQQMTNVNVNVGTAPSTQQVIIVKRGVNHCMHCCISFFFFPWVFVWIFLCITEGN